MTKDNHTNKHNKRNESCIFDQIENTGKLVDFMLYRQKSEEKKRLLIEQRRNREVNLCMGVDIDYLEELRIDTGFLISMLANELGVTDSDLKEYISFNKTCPICFAQNWELTLKNCIS